MNVGYIHCRTLPLNFYVLGGPFTVILKFEVFNQTLWIFSPCVFNGLLIMSPKISVIHLYQNQMSSCLLKSKISPLPIAFQ